MYFGLRCISAVGPAEKRYKIGADNFETISKTLEKRFSQEVNKLLFNSEKNSRCVENLG